MAAILDRLLGIDKPKKKRYTNDEPKHQHRSRSDKPHSSNSRAATSENAAIATASINPQTQEDLRKARVDYWLKPAEERGRRHGPIREEQSSPTASTASSSDKKPRGSHDTKRRSVRTEPSDSQTRTGGRDHNGSGSQDRYTNVYGETTSDPGKMDIGGPVREPRNDADSHSRRSSKASAASIYVRRSNMARRFSETSSVTSSQPALHRSRTTGQMQVNPRPFPATNSQRELVASVQAAPKASRRTHRPTQPRTRTLSTVVEATPLDLLERPQLQRRQTEPPQQTIECSICTDDFPTTQIEALACSHKWCHTCLKRTHFVTSDGHYIDKEPKCCDHPIHLSIAAKVLTPTEQKQWNRKMREKKTENPIYCPTKSCNSRWISPRHIFGTGKQQAAQCTKCYKAVCIACKKPAHGNKNCVKDYTDKEMLAYATREGWKRCPKCKIIIQRDHGCTHMICRNCGENFCYKCGVAYTNLKKTCACELIDAIPDDAEDAWMARRMQLLQWADENPAWENVIPMHDPFRPGVVHAAATMNRWRAELEAGGFQLGNPVQRAAVADRWLRPHNAPVVPGRPTP